ncbi:MAG TPA: GNAT family protein [Pyrinomonadaceae bacterium]|nr:GNAT family protein [Pyrinomonadaceae bacterium]
MFKALRSGPIILYLIEETNLPEVRSMLQGFSDSGYMLGELDESYVPQFDEAGRRTKYGFYSTLDDELAGLSLLGVSSWKHGRGYTGADTLTHMRGRGVAPGSKPHLFYLAFEVLGLNRIETGCFASNVSSKRSIEKTVGFELEGVLREYGLNAAGRFEDEYRYSILKRDWLRLYDRAAVEVIV